MPLKVPDKNWKYCEQIVFKNEHFYPGFIKLGWCSEDQEQDAGKQGIVSNYEIEMIRLDPRTLEFEIRGRVLARRLDRADLVEGGELRLNKDGKVVEI